MGQCTCVTAQKCYFVPTSPSRASLWQTVLTALSALEDGIPHPPYLPASLQFRQPTPHSVPLQVQKGHSFLYSGLCSNVTQSEGLSLAPLQSTPSLPSLDCVGVLFTLFPSVSVYVHLLPDGSPRISTPTGQRPGLSYHYSSISRIVPDCM